MRWRRGASAASADPALGHRAGALLLFASSLIGVAVLQGCGDPGEFRPAKNAPSYEPVREAYRLPTKPAECVELGSVYANGRHALEDLATTAARNGATHYVVQVDRTQVNGYQGNGIGNSSVVAIEVVRTMWARVYRCSTSDKEVATP